VQRKFLIIAAIFGATGVALGAFGAHGLEKITGDGKILHAFHTAVQYQLIHALALIGVGLVYDKLPTVAVRAAGFLFICGVILFSGSLYLLTVFKIEGSSLTRFAGPVTPLGGATIIAGWIALLIGVSQNKRS
jgi:uncharacterized membrane protein YgdD (TMEM256/DUF423 family)